MKKPALLVCLVPVCLLTLWGVVRMVNQAQFIRADEFWRGEPEAIGWMVVAGWPLGAAIVLLFGTATMVSRFK